MATPTADPTPTSAPSRSGGRPVPLVVRSPDGRETTGTLTDLQRGIARVRFDGDDRPSLPTGGTVELELEAPGLPRRLTGHARVLERSEGSEEDPARTYAFRLPRLGDRGGALSASLSALYNRRSAHRVRPAPLEHVSVRVTPEGGGPSERVLLADICSGGLGLRVAGDVEARLSDVERVEVAFQLPDDIEEIQLRAVIRNRQESGHHVRWGLSFEVDRPGPERRAIIGYVSRRQHESLLTAWRSRSRTQH